ncbi:MAG TPA: DNA recombination protein RmuC [Candidatus Angelobacter sp.]|nr:DNA recombination protein RmuC [Candidatus Angelobacter sp.]
MSTMAVVILALAGMVIGAAVGWLATRGQASGLAQRKVELEQELGAVRAQLAQAQAENAELKEAKARAEERLESERRHFQEKVELLTAARDEMKAQFSAMANDALQNNNASFLQLAKTELAKQQSEAKGELEKREKAVETLVKPISDSLKSVDEHVRALENKREAAYGSLTTLVATLQDSQTALKAETGNLVKAMREPQARGRWGELQLKRCLELAGMLEYCDFLEQVSVTSDEGIKRPDVVVKLPGDKNIVVDAKAPLVAYLAALEASDEASRNACLLDHARQVKQHIDLLGAKSYWSQFEPTPEFVVLFLPGEVFFRAAMDADHGLIEYGVARKVIVASPTTLIALLRAVAYGWNQKNLAESAKKISEAGKQLYDRLCVMTAHVDSLGRKLDGSVKAYNEMLSSMQQRVFPAGRRIAELDRSLPAANLPDPKQVERIPKNLESADWQLESEIDPLLLESEDADLREP